MKGVVLLSVGHSDYAKWAHNMAVTCRVMSPNLPITVITDGNYPFEDFHKDAVDDVIVMDSRDFLDRNGKLFPAKAKLSVYKYTPYSEAIYLDVDGCCIKDLNLLFDECKEKGLYFQVQVNGVSTKDHDNLDASLWVKPQQIFDKYDVPEDAELCGTNASFWYFKKGKDAKKLFSQALKNLANPIPVSQLRYKWGHSNTHPDELYMNIALAQVGLKPNIEPVLYLRKRGEGGRNKGLDDIQRSRYIIGCWGDENYNHHEISGTGQPNSGLYNKHVSNCWNKFYGNSVKFGKPNDFFSLIKGKVFANPIK